MAETLEAAAPPLTIEIIRQGSWAKPDIKSVAYGPDRAILKDFSDKLWPVRLLGRRQVAREMRALRRLQGIPGIPRCYGEAGPIGILMEPIEGERITRWCRNRRDQAGPMFEKLQRLVGQIHARGVAHIDLRKRDNILVTEDGRPCIIDFNASFCFDPAGPGARFLFPFLRRIDDSAVLKWKSRLAPELLTAEESRQHRFMSRLRRLWIFN
jgi:tRNA A-37 threonylcarbamoyl transferase component Bud32